ncbi:MAG: hypothetical protein PUD59_01930 [bacterium]|nr:hypothetical protein [bacterium]
MKKYFKILIIAFAFIFFIPSVRSLSNDYEDLVYKVVDKEIEEGKVNLYLFHRESCPHCKSEIEFLDSIKEKYDNLNIYIFEVSKNKENYEYLQSIKTIFNDTSNSVPFTVIGDKYFVGYSEFVGDKIENTIQDYLQEEKQTESEINNYKIPLIGNVNVKDTSLIMISVVLGLVDGFNPCAMWILIFLINMFFGMKNKKRMFIYGYTFLFTSGLVYFLSMLGISFVLNFMIVSWLQKIIALVAITAGVLNIKTYVKTRNDSGCHVVDDKKRKSVFKKVTNIVKEKNIFIALVGIILLAISVNLVELACSIGFPAIFSDILALNKISGLARIIYLLIYVIFYMLDDIVVFTIAVCTLSITTKSTKYTKYVNLIGGLIMIIVGILLIFKPEWIMLNF